VVLFAGPEPARYGVYPDRHGAQSAPHRQLRRWADE
jgi:hypothetical protein